MDKKMLAAGILAVDKISGKILMIKRSILCPEPNTWANVGGKVDQDDLSVRDAAIREFKEEVQPDSPYLLSKKPFFINENEHLKFYTYLAFFDNKFVPILNEENIDYNWFDLDELPQNLLPACRLLFNMKKNDLKKIISFYTNKKKGD